MLCLCCAASCYAALGCAVLRCAVLCVLCCVCCAASAALCCAAMGKTGLPGARPAQLVSALGCAVLSIVCCAALCRLRCLNLAAPYSLYCSHCMSCPYLLLDMIECAECATALSSCIAASLKCQKPHIHPLRCPPVIFYVFPFSFYFYEIIHFSFFKHGYWSLVLLGQCGCGIVTQSCQGLVAGPLCQNLAFLTAVTQ